jgi:lipoprotein-anchoring transpeptidase ErfK/SrfK
MIGQSEWVRIVAIKNRRQVKVWVPAWVTRKKVIDWRVTVDLSSRRATITRGGQVVRRFRVVVGAPSTPTPRGRFFVIDHLRLHNSWSRGAWALALSAYSNVLRNFDGGQGQVAMHAKGSLSNPLGTAASHGCVRFANSAAAWMAGNVPNGSAVDIKA